MTVCYVRSSPSSSVLLLSCERTGPCLCGFVTFWHLRSEASPIQQTRISNPAGALSLCCHAAVTIHTGHLLTWQTQTWTTHRHNVYGWVCVQRYLAIIPRNTVDEIPSPHVYDPILVHHILLELTLIWEVHHIIWYTHNDKSMIFCNHTGLFKDVQL